MNHIGTQAAEFGKHSGHCLYKLGAVYPEKLTVGAGGSFTGDFAAFFVPIGFTMGRKLEIKDSEIRVQPYGEPIITFAFGDVGDNSYAAESSALGNRKPNSTRVSLRERSP